VVSEAFLSSISTLFSASKELVEELLNGAFEELFNWIELSGWLFKGDLDVLFRHYFSVSKELMKELLIGLFEELFGGYLDDLFGGSCPSSSCFVEGVCCV
jgi:hypothetical protein